MIADPIEHISFKLACMLKKHIPEIQSDVDDIRYFIAGRINFYIVPIVSLIIGAATGEFFNTGIALLSFIILRSMSGGGHMPTLTSCAIVSILLFSVIPHLTFTPTVVLIINVLSLLLNGLFSTNGLGHDRHKRFKKLMSVVLVLASLIIGNNTVTLTFLAQSISLIPVRR